MRVNITGKGIIPGLGTLAPRYNVELSEMDIRKLTLFDQFRVSEAETGLLITRINVNNFFKKRLVTDIPKVKKPAVKKDTPKVTEVKEITPKIEEFTQVTEAMHEPLPEIASPDVVVEVTSTSERIGNVVEVTPDEVINTQEEEVEEITETATLEAEPTPYNTKRNKKKNKR